MTEENKNTDIVAVVKQGDHVNFVNSSTGGTAIYVNKGDSIVLSKGVIYELPIKDTELNLKNHYVIKDNPALAAKMLIRTVSDGIATVYPLINGVVINDGDVIGQLI